MTEARRSGGDFYDQPEVFARYTAPMTAGSSDPTFVMEEPAVLAEIGDPHGLRVLDLGCGDASFGRALLDAGARSYHGLDASRMMVSRARDMLRGSIGTVSRADLEHSFEPPLHSFDLVTSRLALHYIGDLQAVLDKVGRCLVPGGRFVMSVVHPVITSHDSATESPRTSWTVDDYFTTGARERSWMGGTVTWYHRTVEQYLDALEAAGLMLTRLRECEPDESRFDGNTGELIRRRRVPSFLVLHART